MVRADILDAMDEVLRRYRSRNQPFGGVQLLMIGDLHQLSPIVKPDEWQLLRAYYDTIFFFSSRALKQTPLVNIELKHIYRQADTSFIDLLNAIRENRITQQVLADLNKRYVPDFKPNESEGYITLTTHNNSAQHLNTSKLAQIKATTHQFKAVVQGDFPEFAYPTVFDLELKVGAQVMFVKNDSSRDKLFYNGKIGKVLRIADEVIYVKCPGDDDEIGVGPMIWQNIKYALNPATKEVQENITGSFTQYPLRLAWAITIHKSQGLTFEKAIIDAEDAFTHGQVYVALSRCKTLEGMVLSSPLKGKSVITDQTVANYTLESERNAPTEDSLLEAKKTFQEVLLRDLFDFNPVKYKFFALLKLAEENDHLLAGKFADTLHQLKTAVEKEIYTVADKFQQELNQLLQQTHLPENHEVLQERVKKAGTYFLSKLEPMLLLPLQKLAVETDNKAIRKVVLSALNGLKQEIIIKFQVLKEASVNGFKALNYLQNKANAAIDFVSVAAEKSNASAKTITIESDPEKYNFPDLFNALRSWRNRLAEEKNVPAYVILHQKVLESLVEKLPSTLAELEMIKGIGKGKIDQYGEEILAYINAYCKNKNIERMPFVAEKVSIKTASTVSKIDTKQVSYDLFKSGKTIAEIAAERSLTSGTIENHLLY
ncbi:MAG: helicase, partial [Sphingobacteriaceae bacterium]